MIPKTFSIGELFIVSILKKPLNQREIRELYNKEFPNKLMNESHTSEKLKELESYGWISRERKGQEVICSRTKNGKYFADFFKKMQEKI